MPAKTSSTITRPKKADKRITDPVTPEQGGRLTPCDPAHALSATREEAVRKIAYEIYLMRGREEGRADQDWLEAEAQYRELVGD